MISQLSRAVLPGSDFLDGLDSVDPLWLAVAMLWAAAIVVGAAFVILAEIDRRRVRVPRSEAQR